MDHLAYYGLAEEPFSIVPLTNFYYHSDEHDRAFARLTRVVEGMKGLGVLVGDIGTGKTLLARRLLENLPDDRFEVSLLVVLHSDVSSEWLVKRIAAQFGVEHDGGNKVDVLQKLYERLFELAEQGKQSVILIDEAHMLRDTSLLEEIRGLLNLELPEKKLITFVLFGMLELDDCLAKERALAQRIAVRYELKPFPLEVVSDYISFRLSQAGCEDEIFSAEAVEEIHTHSRGVPRLINVICDNALFEGFVRKAELPLEAEIIADVCEDLGLDG
jgi:type II secretory pathway predicted ATPase ExeA